MEFQDQPDKPTYLIRDNDAKFPRIFDETLELEGVEVVRTCIQAPNMNAHMERWIQSLQVECLDHFIVFGEDHFRLLIQEYLAHYNSRRPHQSLGNLPLNGNALDPPPDLGPRTGRLHSIARRRNAVAQVRLPGDPRSRCALIAISAQPPLKTTCADSARLSSHSDITAAAFVPESPDSGGSSGGTGFRSGRAETTTRKMESIRLPPDDATSRSMKRNLSFRIMAPSIFVGLLLLAGSVLSVRYTYLLQTNSARILSENVGSLEAAQALEIQVRQLRFHNLLYLLDPQPKRLARIEDDERLFEEALTSAKDASTSDDEIRLVSAIEEGYHTYKEEQTHLRTKNESRPISGVHQLVDSRPVRGVVDPCQRLFRLNHEKLAEGAKQNAAVSREALLAMLFLGIAGPVAGLVAGFGIARAFRKSIYRLSVQVHDIAQQLDRELGSVDVVADGNLQTLEDQIELVVHKVEQAAMLLQRQQNELMRAEQLSQVGQLAAGIAHEIRNPLTGIKLLVEAALRTTPRRSLGEADLQVISREVRRMERSVQSLLDFARLPEPQRQRCDLRTIVDQAWELVRTRCEQQKIAVSRRAPETPVEALVDPGQFATVLVNLLLNGLDALPAGGSLATELGQSDDGAIEIRVCDSGPGIDPSVLDRLFVPFATTKANGTGLGLSLSKRILEEHGGDIVGYNRAEGGACFRVRLPGLGAAA